MVFNNGTGITDHIAMLDKLIAVVTSRNLTTAVFVAGGINFVVNEILSIDSTGATSSDVAQLEVVSVLAGVITALRIYRGGAYTVDPTNVSPNTLTSTGFTANGTATTPGTGATATLTFSGATWAENRRTKKAVTAAAVVVAGGTGYSVSDVLTVLGTVQGDGGSDVTYTVLTLSGSAVATVSAATTTGNLEEVPSNPASTSVLPSGGTGCTLTVTYETPSQSQSDAQVAMLQGEGLAGTDAIHVIIKTFTQSSGFDDAYNWALMGATGYTAGVPIHNQTGINSDQIDISDGSLPSAGLTTATYVLKNADGNTNIEWWINHNGRRIILICKVEGSSTTLYSSCYMGFLNQLATETEYPYPLWICGNTADQNRLWTDTTELTGGIVEVISDSNGDPAGPGYLRLPDGTWLSFAGEISAAPASRNIETEFGIYPFINRALNLSDAEETVDSGSAINFATGTLPIIPLTGVPGTPGVQLKPTTGSGAVRYWLVAPIVLRVENSGLNQFPEFFNMFGEIDGVFWFSTGNNTVVSEDRFELSAARHTIFANGNRTQVWSYFALSED